MKKQPAIFGAFILGLAVLTLSAASQQEKSNKGKAEQQQGKVKEQNKQGKADKQPPAAVKDIGRQEGKTANKNTSKENRGKAEGKGKNDQDGKDTKRGNDNLSGNPQLDTRKGNSGKWANAGGYTWNRETFKERGKIRSKEKVSVCHKFNNNEPAVTIRVSSHALDAHMKHGDVVGDCPSYKDGRFSEIFLRNRSDYYNSLYYAQDQVSYSQSILDYALGRLTNSRLQLSNMQNNNFPPADIQRRQATVYELEQNVSLLQTLVGAATTLIVNKLQQ